jgi:hypothetical protein
VTSQTVVRGGGARRAPATHLLDNAVWAAPAGPHAVPHSLNGPGNVVGVEGADTVPDGWGTVGGGQGVQLVDTALGAEEAPGAVRLGPDDVPEILDLVATGAG